MAKNAVITVRLDPEVKRCLDELANKTRRARSVLAAEAITTYVEHKTWQVTEIERGIKQADAGEFMTDQELAGSYKRWTS